MKVMLFSYGGPIDQLCSVGSCIYYVDYVIPLITRYDEILFIRYGNDIFQLLIKMPDI